MSMDERMIQHLANCMLTERTYKKLGRKMDAMLPTCETSSEFLVTFANKCYTKEPDRSKAKRTARTFLESLYGSIDSLLNFGPEAALDIVVYGKSKQLIKFEKNVGPRSCHGIHLCGPEEVEDIETHPMWTEKLLHYLVGPTLGVGGTAEVRLVWDLKAKKKFAMKIVFPKHVKRGITEISILKSLHHKNIVQVFDHYENVLLKNKKTSVFVMEYAPHGDLLSYLMYTSRFEDKLARWFFHSLVRAVEYCHSRNIVHRDLKHENCLLGKDFVLKVTDFGFSKQSFNELMKTQIGTMEFVAPEVLLEKKYTKSVDIFSMGVMLFMVLAGTPPWHVANHRIDKYYRMVHYGRWEEFFKYHERSYTFKGSQKTILIGMLEPDPERRWTLLDVQQCRWFKGKKISQENVAARLQERKHETDMKKIAKMKFGGKENRRGLDIFSKKLPRIYFQPAPPLSFVTYKKAEWVLEDIAKCIARLRGVVSIDRERYKLTFHVIKLVDKEQYISKKENKNKIIGILVNASVQMWTLQGQQKALSDRNRALTVMVENKRTLTDEEKILTSKNIRRIKSIAVFRSEGNTSEAKHLFPRVYSDILQGLPVDIFYKDLKNVELRGEYI